jgi:hypothetical protein
MKLFEILVPTKFEDTGGPVKLCHHKEWDKVILRISGGMTILRASIGRWVDNQHLYEDRVIPVRIACTSKQMEEIAAFTKRHYRQIAVMYYKLSDDVYIV